MKRLTSSAFLLFTAFILQAQTYHEADKEGLRQILRQHGNENDQNGNPVFVKNFELFGLTEADTLQWDIYEEWVGKIEHLAWNDENPKKIKEMMVSKGKNETDFDFSYFSQLEKLSVAINRAGIYFKTAIIDISNNDNLKYLKVHNTELKNYDFINYNLEEIYIARSEKLLDFSLFPNLKSIYFIDTSANTINTTNNPLLEKLIIGGVINSVPEMLDLTANKNLKHLSLTGTNNKLRNLDITQNTRLERFELHENAYIRHLDISQNTNLNYISIRYLDELTEIQWGNTDTLIYYYNRGSVPHLDLTDMSRLKYLEAYGNMHATLDVSTCYELNYIDCSSNLLTKIELPENNTIETLNCSNNSLLFSTLPLPDIANYNYQSQWPIYAADLPWKEPIDLSSEYDINGNITEYRWYTDSNPVEVSGSNGIFNPTADMVGKTYICEMTNSGFPQLTLQYIITIENSTSSSTDMKGNIIENKIFPQSTVVGKNEPIVLNSGLTGGVIELYSISGKKVFSGILNEGKNYIPGQPVNGMYISTIKTNAGQKSTYKIIVN